MHTVCGLGRGVGLGLKNLRRGLALGRKTQPVTTNLATVSYPEFPVLLSTDPASSKPQDPLNKPRQLFPQPPCQTYPFGGQEMLTLGFLVDSAVEEEFVHQKFGTTPSTEPLGKYLASLKRSFYSDRVTQDADFLQGLPNFQRISDLHDPWTAFSSSVIRSIIEVPESVKNAWAHLPCGETDDVEATPLLGLERFKGVEEKYLKKKTIGVAGLAGVLCSNSGGSGSDGEEEGGEGGGGSGGGAGDQGGVVDQSRTGNSRRGGPTDLRIIAAGGAGGGGVEEEMGVQTSAHECFFHPRQNIAQIFTAQPQDEGPEMLALHLPNYNTGTRGGRRGGAGEGRDQGRGGGKVSTSSKALES